MNKPKIPKPIPVATPATLPAAAPPMMMGGLFSSAINSPMTGIATSIAGILDPAQTQKKTLIGGSA